MTDTIKHFDHIAHGLSTGLLAGGSRAQRRCGDEFRSASDVDAERGYSRSWELRTSRRCRSRSRVNAFVSKFSEARSACTSAFMSKARSARTGVRAPRPLAKPLRISPAVPLQPLVKPMLRTPHRPVDGRWALSSHKPIDRSSALPFLVVGHAWALLSEAPKRMSRAFAHARRFSSCSTQCLGT